MHTNLILVPVILNLFDGEGGGAPTGETAPAAGEQTGDLSKVVYGVQPESAEEPTQQGDAVPAEQQTDDRAKMYRDMIQGEYKDLYNEDVQRIVKGRLRDMDQLRQQNNAQQEVIDRLAAKYGVTDLQEIANAIDNDTSMWEREADEAGMTTDQYMKYQSLQRQNAQLIREEQQRIEAVQRQQRINAWMKEAEGVKAQYPGFDLPKEVANDRFVSMLNSGVPMLEAFRVMHFDELQNYTAQSAAHQAEAAVAANVRANGFRPLENGTKPQSAFTVKRDVSKLTKADRAEIARRVQRGERIQF